MDTLELARQITLRFFRVYRKIEIKEFFKLGWMKKDALNRSPNLVEVRTLLSSLSLIFFWQHLNCVLQMTDMFNDVSSWVVNSILRAPEAHRVSFIEKAIDTVRHCLGLSNFQVTQAIRFPINLFNSFACEILIFDSVIRGRWQYSPGWSTARWPG